MINIRHATETDQNIIKEMVRQEELDPTSLHWSHFLVAEADGQIAGIGQIRPYKHCRELGSLVVHEAYRKRGVGSQIVQALLAAETGDVHLECLHFNERYYARFGFKRIVWWQAPMPLKLKVGMGQVLGPIFGYRVIAMRRTAPVAG